MSLFKNIYTYFFFKNKIQLLGNSDFFDIVIFLEQENIMFCLFIFFITRLMLHNSSMYIYEI